MRIVILAFLLIIGVSFAAACQQGDEWMEKCNRCWCVNGNKACTKMMCLGDRNPSKTADTAECEDGDTWKDDCNNCFCQGGHKYCTRKLCRGSRKP